MQRRLQGLALDYGKLDFKESGREPIQDLVLMALELSEDHTPICVVRVLTLYELYCRPRHHPSKR